MGNEPRVSDEALAGYCSDPDDKTGEWPGDEMALQRVAGRLALDLRDARAERDLSKALLDEAINDISPAEQRVRNERDAAQAQVAMLREATQRVVRTAIPSITAWLGQMSHNHADTEPGHECRVCWCLRELERTTRELNAALDGASADAFVARTRALALEPFLELDPHLGYEPDIDRDGRIDGWYCRSHRCTQPFGKPHLDACEIGPLLRPLAGQPSAEKLT